MKSFWLPCFSTIVWFHLSIHYTIVDCSVSLNCNPTPKRRTSDPNAWNIPECFYECTDKATIVIIPIGLLRSYNIAEGISRKTLVTSSGCEVMEVNEHNGVDETFVQLTIPHDKCGTKQFWNFDGPAYESFPVLSYIGTRNNIFEQEIYTAESSCDNDAHKFNADEIPSIFSNSMCTSSSHRYIVPSFDDLEVKAQFFPLFNSMGLMQSTGGKKPYGGSDDYSLFGLVDGGYNLNLASPPDSLSGVEIYFKNGGNMGVLTAWKNGKIATFTLLPTCALGYEYVLMSYPSEHSYMIIMPEDDDTDVELIAPNSAKSVKFTGYPKKQMKFSNQVTGTLIKSSKPVAVFSMMINATVPYRFHMKNSNIDHMAEQLIPIRFWESTYISGSGHQYILRVLAGSNRATIKLEHCKYFYIGHKLATDEYTLLPYSYKDFVVSEGPCVVDGKGTEISVAQIGKSDLKGGKIYPYMVMLTPTGKHVLSMQVPKVDSIIPPTISLTTLSTTVSDILIDGIEINSNIWKHINNFAHTNLISPGPNSMIYSTNTNPDFATFGSVVYWHGKGGTSAYSGAWRFINFPKILVLHDPSPDIRVVPDDSSSATVAINSNMGLPPMFRSRKLPTSAESSTVQSITSQATIAVPPVVNCMSNPCGENGVCKEKKIGFYCDCNTGFDGSLCEIKSSPDSGPYIMNGADFSLLFPPDFYRSTSAGFVIELILLNKRLVIRSLEGCPNEVWCGQFLTATNNTVYFTNVMNGYQKWISVPSSNSYILKTENNEFLGMGVNGIFILTNDSSKIIQIQFEDLIDSRKLLMDPVLTYPVALFPNSALVNASLTIDIITDDPVCLWFYALQDSDLHVPVLTATSSIVTYTYKEVSSPTTSSFLLYDKFGTQILTLDAHYNVLKKMQWHHICLDFVNTGLVMYINGYQVLQHSFNVTVQTVSLQRCHNSDCFVGEAKHLAQVKTNTLTKAIGIYAAFANENFYDYANTPLNGFGFVVKNETIVTVALQYCTGLGVNINNLCFYASPLSYVENGRKLLDSIDRTTHLRLSHMLGAISPTHQSFDIGAYRLNNSVKWSNHENVDISGTLSLLLWAPGEPSQDGSICYSPSSSTSEKNSHPMDYRWTLNATQCTNQTDYISIQQTYPISPHKLHKIFFLDRSSELKGESFKTYIDTMKLILKVLPAFSLINMPLIPSILCKTKEYRVAEVDQVFDNLTPENESLSIKEVFKCLHSNSPKIFTLIKPDDITMELKHFLSTNKVFLIGMGNVTLDKMNNISADPEYNVYLPTRSRKWRQAISSTFTNKFFKFLAGSKLPNTNAILKASKSVIDCLLKPCLNDGICIPNSGQMYTCACAEGFQGVNCQYISPKVECGTLGMEVLLSKSNVVFMSSQSLVNNTQLNIYWDSYHNNSDCRTQTWTTIDGKEVYRLFVPSPFDKCGLSTKISNSSVIITGTIMFNLINLPKFVNMETVVANVTCNYGRNLNIEFRPDNMLSSLFQPVQNNLFSSTIKKRGKFVIKLLLYRDVSMTQPITENSTVVIGNQVYVLVKAITNIPDPLTVQADNCYLSPNPDAGNKSVILDIVKLNCASVNELPKQLISVQKQEVKFQFQVFEWQAARKNIHLHCAVSICDASEARCNSNCLSTTRKKRDLSHDKDSDVIQSKSFIIVPQNYSSIIPKEALDYANSQDDFVQEDYLIKDKKSAFTGLFLFINLFYGTIIIVLLLCCVQRNRIMPRLHSYGNVFYKRNSILDSLLASPVDFGQDDDVLLQENSNNNEAQTSVKAIAEVHHVPLPDAPSCVCGRERRSLSTFLGNDARTKL